MMLSSDDDSDEGELNSSLPFLSDGVATSSQGDQLDLQSIATGRIREEDLIKKIGELVKDVSLFDGDDVEVSEPIMEIETREIELHPPGVAFFTSTHHQLYTEESLIWPFPDASSPYAKLSPATRTQYIKNGYFQRIYSSKRTTQLIMKYLFHLCCCTTDTELLYQSYSTICYMAEHCEPHFDICQELSLALANLGADIKCCGRDPSLIKSPVIPESPGEMDGTGHSSLQENMRLVLEFLSILLSCTTTYKEDDLDMLIKILLAIGLDPTVITLDLDSQIARCISHTLNLYPSDDALYQRVQDLVETIIQYCNSHHHTVAYACTRYNLPTCRSQVFLSSLAFLQLELSLQTKEKNSLDYVEMEDVKSLVEDQMEVLLQATDHYMLCSAIKLLVCCIGDGPFTDHQKKDLNRICDIIESVITGKNFTFDDMATNYFRYYGKIAVSNWRGRTLSSSQQDSPQKRDNNPHSPSANPNAVEEIVLD